MHQSKGIGLRIALTLLLFLYGLAGCGTLSPSNAPVDCDAVKNQEQAGYSDAKIAADLNTTADKIAACHGPKTAVGPQD